MPDVHVLIVLPDGTAIGADDDGNSYQGTRAEVAYEAMTVNTAVADDGLSYVRDILLPDGTPFGHGEFTYDGFAKMERVQALVNDTEVDEDEIQTRWDAMKAITQLDSRPLPASIWTWAALPATQEA